MTNLTSTNSMQPAFTVNATVGPSSLTLSWNAIFADSYVVRCSSTSNSSANDSECLEKFNPIHIFSLCADGNTSSVTLDQLVPRTTYTCCVSNASGEAPLGCEEGLVLSGGFSSLIVGLIGAAAGIALALLVALLIAMLVACCLCKRRRTIPRAQRQLASVMRTPSQKCFPSNEKAGFLRTASQFRPDQQQPQQPQQQDFMTASAKTTTTTFTSKSRTFPLREERTDSDDFDDLGYLYTSALSQKDTLSRNQQPPPVPKTEEAGQFGMMAGSLNVEDGDQYEVMLATASNPAYNNVQRARGELQAPTQIYEQMP